MTSAAGVPRGPTKIAPGFPAWISYFPSAKRSSEQPSERPDPAGSRPHSQPATLIFPHAGGAAVNYRALAAAVAAAGSDAYIMQYPKRADRFREPPAETLPELARDLFEAGPWNTLGELQLFGHSMGSLVAFEFARIAENAGLPLRRLWASAGPAPSTAEEAPRLPTDHVSLLADLSDLGGTDPRLLADDGFARLLTDTLAVDYAAMNRYRCAPDVALAADIRVVGADDDFRVPVPRMQAWQRHTSGGFDISLTQGGHFYFHDQLDDLAARIASDA